MAWIWFIRILSEFILQWTWKIWNPCKLCVLILSKSNDFVANLNSIYNASLTATSYYVHNKVYVPSVELNPQIKLLFTNSIHRILFKTKLQTSLVKNKTEKIRKKWTQKISRTLNFYNYLGTKFDPTPTLPCCCYRTSRCISNDR